MASAARARRQLAQDCQTNDENLMNKPAVAGHWLLLPCIMMMATASLAADVEKVIQTEQRTQQSASQSQKRIDRTSSETQKLLEQFREALWKRKQLSVYAEQLGELVAAQDTEKASLQRQIGAVDDVQEEIMPLMLRMVDTLEEFIKLDVPFLPEERAERITKLREELGNAESSVAEKYRRVLEAYQVEAEYGRTLETYRGDLQFGEVIRAVDFLRVGRVGLYYVTLDDGQAGFWNTRARQWQSVGGDYLKSIRRGIRLAKQQIAPELLELPVPAPVVAANGKGGK